MVTSRNSYFSPLDSDFFQHKAIHHHHPLRPGMRQFEGGKLAIKAKKQVFTTPPKHHNLQYL